MPEPKPKLPLPIRNPGTQPPEPDKVPGDKKPDTGIPLYIEDPNDQPFDQDRQREWEESRREEPDTAPRGSEDVTDWGRV